MPRSPVKTTYTKASVTPSKRERIHPAFVPQAKEPKGLSPLAAYLFGNEDTGISTSELIVQFQEYDCEHSNEQEVARSSTKISYACQDCGRLRSADRPGVK